MKYADFKSRSARPEFWWWILVSTVVSVVTSGSVLSTLWTLATICPTLAVGWRRMHDIDKAGPFIFIPIFSIVLAAQPGTPGPNRFDGGGSVVTNFTETPLGSSDCQNCGKMALPGQQFCQSCGAQLS